MISILCFLAMIIFMFYIICITCKFIIKGVGIGLGILISIIASIIILVIILPVIASLGIIGVTIGGILTSIIAVLSFIVCSPFFVGLCVLIILIYICKR
ncbi:hypothetical protein [Clostridium sp. ATCC 25772]|uniref:hypothetical protein n=1 Tax=Clostridium sp. ATCC 25772 TaxID=1676991 RepID=UPI0007843629|nr:hypothetical protein [Clostridium sp. ATCC 25772]